MRNLHYYLVKKNFILIKLISLSLCFFFLRLESILMGLFSTLLIGWIESVNLSKKKLFYNLEGLDENKIRVMFISNLSDLN